jgi:hypothetical protein
MKLPEMKRIKRNNLEFIVTCLRKRYEVLGHTIPNYFLCPRKDKTRSYKQRSKVF